MDDEEKNQIEGDSRARWAFGVLIALGVFAGVSFLLVVSHVLLSQREGSRRERCEYNLSQLYRATCEYVDAYGTYPPAYTVDSEGTPLHSWRVLLLPYLGEEDLYSQIRLNEAWNSEWNSQFWNKTPSLFQCSSIPVHSADGSENRDKTKRCSFSCVLGTSTLFPSNGKTVSPDEVVDGVSNTVVYVERGDPGNGLIPDDELHDEQPFRVIELPGSRREGLGSWHGAGGYVLLADGSTRFLSEKIDTSVLKLLLNIDDSKVVEEKNDGVVDEETEENK